jgi:hypothetical protein
MLANFYSEDFKQCLELGEKIEHASFQSWLFLNYAKQQLGLLNMDDVAVQQGIKEFAQDDWPLLLDRLHIPQDEVRQKLADFLSGI